jgi:hypothetical protein
MARFVVLAHTPILVAEMAQSNRRRHLMQQSGVSSRRRALLLYFTSFVRVGVGNQAFETNRKSNSPRILSYHSLIGSPLCDVIYFLKKKLTKTNESSRIISSDICLIALPRVTAQSTGCGLCDTRSTRHALPPNGTSHRI